MTPQQITEAESDLALAAELQAALLPKACPTDCPNHVAAARNRMYAGVGGDFYDFIPVNPEQIALVIGDVVGHGVRASLVMAQIMGLLRTEPVRLSRPGEMVSAINEMLIDLGDRIGAVVHCSLVYGVIDTPTGAGFFVNAGHPRPLICKPDKAVVMPLGRSDMLLGIEPFKPTETCHAFTPGERLVMFTDGILEAANSADERFGDDRLYDVIDAHLADTPDACADAVFRAVDEFRGVAPQIDDETIVVIDRV